MYRFCSVLDKWKRIKNDFDEHRVVSILRSIARLPSRTEHQNTDLKPCIERDNASSQLLLACKEIHKEATSILYAKIKFFYFDFENIYYFQRAMREYLVKYVTRLLIRGGRCDGPETLNALIYSHSQL